MYVEKLMSEKPLGRPTKLKDKVYVNFWAEREFFDTVKALSVQYSVSRSEMLRILIKRGLKGINAYMKKRQKGE